MQLIIAAVSPENWSRETTVNVLTLFSVALVVGAIVGMNKLTEWRAARRSQAHIRK